MDLPEDFLDLMQQELGDETIDLVRSIGSKTPVSIRTNPAKNVSQFDGAEPIPWHPNGKYLQERPVFTLDPSFHGGAYYVQEASSMLIYQALTQSLDLGKKQKVLDLCSAPGGKSTLLASIISSDSFLVSNEVIRSRVAPLKLNLTKWGHPNYLISNHDVADFSEMKGYFDAVLVDAPCSGEGLFRKDKKAISEWSLENVGICAARQKRILEMAEKLVKPGGVLIYSTCTYNRHEDEDNVKWFIDRGNYQKVEIQLKKEWGVTQKKFGYQCYPFRVKGEGFYFSVLRRTSRETTASKIKSSPLRNLKKIGKSYSSKFMEWLEQPTDFQFFEKPQGEVIAVPKTIIKEVNDTGHVLKRRAFGVEIGVIKKNNFVPSHALALSNCVRSDIPSIELDLSDALVFLKKENKHFENGQKGWCLVKYNGLILGWIKILDNRTNNYLPMDWRIRMDIKR